MERVSFLRLEDAVDFLVIHLESGDAAGIADQCLAADEDREPTDAGARSSREYRLAAIEELARRHGMQSLRSTYAGREFPADAAKLKLGGHDAELGHVHVDFVRTAKGWQLKEIWICR